MNILLHVIEVSGKGVEVATLASTAETFWLPRAAVKWAEIPEPGTTVTAKLPRWLRESHSPLRPLRGQFALPLHGPVELDPILGQRRIPMADDRQNTGRGALFRISPDDKKNDKWPDYRGDVTIEGVKWKLAGWVKTDKNGGKYLSLVAKPFQEQRQQPEPQSSYARATGRDDQAQQRQPQRPAGGQSFADTDIPFGPEVR